MTGKELIELIQKNNAEELQIMLIDQNSGFACEKFPAKEFQIEVDKNKNVVVIY